jgi:hypothetical protein
MNYVLWKLNLIVPNLNVSDNLYLGFVHPVALRWYINEKIKPPLFTTISHRVFIIYVFYYMFRLHISHLQVYHV